jgi:hypothetical protein
MGTSPTSRTENTQLTTGSRLLLLGGILFVIGLVVVLVVPNGTPEGIGIVFMSLAVVPTLAGGALMLSGFVSRRSRQGKPFA